MEEEERRVQKLLLNRMPRGMTTTQWWVLREEAGKKDFGLWMPRTEEKTLDASHRSKDFVCLAQK